MELTVRPSEERGHNDHGWLKTRFAFSFADYFDPAHMGFRSLRVLNEDHIAAGKGFGEHPHKDMEILTYVLAGAVEHRDSMGNGAIVRPGEMQRMTAGTGVVHSERNPSPDEALHLFQVWIEPEQRGLEPSYEQRPFAVEERRGRLRLVASKDGREDSVQVHQDVDVYTSLLEPGEDVVHELGPGRHAWIQVASGAFELGGTTLGAGDGAAVSDARELRVVAREAGELLLFDLA